MLLSLNKNLVLRPQHRHSHRAFLEVCRRFLENRGEISRMVKNDQIMKEMVSEILVKGITSDTILAWAKSDSGLN